MRHVSGATSGRKMRSWWGWWLRLRRRPLLLALVALLVTEGVLQVLLADWREHTFFFPERNVLPSSAYAEDPELFWMPTDRFAGLMRQTAVAPRSDRLLFFGDSVVYGHREPATSFPAQLQGRLDADPARRHYRVLNFAYYGYSSQQALTLARRVVPRDGARLIFFSAGANDLARANQSDRQIQAANRGAAKRLLWQFNRVKLFALYRHFLLMLRRPDEFDYAKAGVPRVGPQEFAENLSAFAELARQAGATLVLMTQENTQAGNRRSLDTYNAAMIDLARARPEIVLLEVRKFLHQLAGSEVPDYANLPDLPLFVDVCHFSPFGNGQVAGFLDAELTKRGLLP